MSPIKQTLLHAVKDLSEDEAQKAMAYIEALRRNAELARLHERLGGRPDISLPAPQVGGFPDVEPIRGKGVPASELLVRDRR